eukprot:gene2610-4050_t
MFTAVLEGLEEYVTAHCANQDETLETEDFIQRYHPFIAALYGNALYKDTVMPRKNCLDGDNGFTRDLIKILESLTGKSSFEMPASCPFYFWEQKQKCSFAYEMMEFDAEMQVVVHKCERHPNFVKVNIGCAGEGCSVLRPCSSDDDCGAMDHLQCTDPFEWLDPKTKGAPKFKEEDVYNFFRDTFHVFAGDRTFAKEECPEFSPKKLFRQFVNKFAHFFVNSPESRRKSSCEGGACKICLPVHTNAFESTAYGFQDRWKELTDEYPKNRARYETDNACTLSAARLAANNTPLYDDPKAPTIVDPVQPPGMYPDMARQFSMGSPLAMGTQIFVEGAKYQIGGGMCVADSHCSGDDGIKGLCLSASQYCSIAFNECDRASTCEWNAQMDKCVPMQNTFQNSKLCACFAVERRQGGGSRLVYGQTCTRALFINEVDEDNILDLIYTDEIHKWRARYDPFTYWDGYYSSDGLDPFAMRDHWPRFPLTEAPGGESHLASVQCNGVIHLFQQTPYALRVYAPMLNDVAEFFGRYGYDTWMCRADKTIRGSQYAQMNRERYLLAQAIWRPEPYLYAKVRDTNGVNSKPGGFNETLVDWLFPYNDSGPVKTRPRFDWWNGEQMLGLAPKFTLTEWFASQYAGMSYQGLRYIGGQEVMGSDFALNLRFDTCPGKTFGLAKIDLTCNGKTCEDLQLRTLCQSDAQCTPPSICHRVLQDWYDTDIVAQMLWGVSRTPTLGNRYTLDSLCPALEAYGPNGSTSYVIDKVPAHRMSSYLWNAMQYADCGLRHDEESCWGHCTWDITNEKCLDPTNPKAVPMSSALMFCRPEVDDPTVYDALVTKRKFASAIINEPNTAGLYSVELAIEHQTVAVQAFGFEDTSRNLRRATSVVTESVYRIDEDIFVSPFGISFVAAMVGMGILVIISAMCVWWHYVRVTKKQREHQAQLHGISFEYEPENATYGKDLMLPEMYKWWLPGSN